MQFIYLLVKQEIRIANDYERNKVYLPSRSFEVSTIIIWRANMRPWRTRKKRDYKCPEYRIWGGKTGNISFGWILVDIVATRWKIDWQFRITWLEWHNALTLILLSAYLSVSLTCLICASFSIGGMKYRHDAILESCGTTAKFINSLTPLPSTTYSILISRLFSLLPSKFFFLLLIFLVRKNYSQSNFNWATKRISSKIF